MELEWNKTTIVAHVLLYGQNYRATDTIHPYIIHIFNHESGGLSDS